MPALIAARRIASDPSATFRAVSVVVLAAFAVTCSATLVDASEAGPFDGGRGVLRPGVVEVLTGGVPEAKVAPLLSERTVPIRSDIGVASDFVESCAELARVVTLSCSSSGLAEGGISERAELADTDLPISTVYIPTDRTPAAENRVRTQAANLVPNAIIHTQQDRIDTDAFFFGSLEQLQRLVWYFVLLGAACSLTVGMLAGVIERRRPFALLRASGLGELRQVVFLETAVAMLVTAAWGWGSGWRRRTPWPCSATWRGRGRTSASSPWSASACSPHSSSRQWPSPAGRRDATRRRPVRVAPCPRGSAALG